MTQNKPAKEIGDLLGRQYRGIRESLPILLRDGSLELAEISGIGHLCYYCRKPVKGIANRLTQKEGASGVSVYFVDDQCYRFHFIESE